MKTLVNKIFLTVTFLFLSLSVFALPENNSIIRFASKRTNGTVVYAMSKSSDNMVYAIAEGESGYVYVNTLWLVTVNGTSLTFRNVGTGKYLSTSTKNGYGFLGFLRPITYLTTNNSSGTSFSEKNEKYYTGDYLYIQFDPNEEEWRCYQENGDNKETSQDGGNKGTWSDELYPPANEKESTELSGSEVKDLFGDDHGNIDINAIKTDILNNPTKIEDYQEASSSTVTTVKVGNSSTYPTSNYWKQTNIELDINSSKWTPVSFPVYVEVIGNVADVWYQWYDAKERASSGNGWKKAQLTVGTKFEPGKAYNFATGSTANKTITFQPTSEENGTIIELASRFDAELKETGGTPKNENWYYIGNAMFSDAVIGGAVEYACKPDKNGGYLPVDLKNKESFGPFETFFVQFQGWYALAKPTASSASAAPMLNRGNVTEKYSVEINGEGNYYHTGIYFAEDASVDEYVSGEDFLSFANKKGAGVQLYSVEDDGDYAFNKRPIENTVVRLGLYVGTAGRYTISLNNISGNAETFVLYDNYEQDFVRLHLGETYTFDSERGSFDDRFVVAVTYAPGTTTDNVSLEAVNLVVVGNEIQGVVEGADYAIYNSTGSLVYSDVAYAETVTLPNLTSGVYIVRTATGWTKFVVK